MGVGGGGVKARVRVVVIVEANYSFVYASVGGLGGS